jgi:hypothetical protein
MLASSPSFRSSQGRKDRRCELVYLDVSHRIAPALEMLILRTLTLRSLHGCAILTSSP